MNVILGDKCSKFPLPRSYNVMKEVTVGEKGAYDTKIEYSPHAVPKVSGSYTERDQFFNLFLIDCDTFPFLEVYVCSSALLDHNIPSFWVAWKSYSIGILKEGCVWTTSTL